MPSLTQPPSKKRRHDDFDTGAEYHMLYEQLYRKSSAEPPADKLNLSPQDFHHDIYPQRHGPPPRKMKSLSSPRAKKLRMMAEQQQDGDDQTPYLAHSLQQQTSPRPTPLAPSSRHNHTRSPSAGKLGTRTTITTNVLAPCHICHRRPTKKTELASYADCQGCGERTCYVCMRECMGWGVTPQGGHSHDDHEEEVLMRDEDTNSDHEQRSRIDTGHDHSFHMEDAPPEDAHIERGSPRADHRIREGTWVREGSIGHRGRICSRCCVEEGVDGEVTCLGCLAA